jgi:dephospho-CoA kinase
MTQIKIIGLSGRADSGKTTVARYLVEQYGFVRTAFGDPLKQMLLDAGMCTREELWGEKTPQSR